MNNNIVVLPSARAIRAKFLELDNDTAFLPNYITMSEFISKLSIVDGFKILDEDSRVLLLLEASNFKTFQNLQIQRNFFTFTKNSSYIFKFFEELSAELFSIDELSGADVYAEYEEHITILQELYKRYKTLCFKRKLLDKIFLPTLYRFNHHFIKDKEKITLYLDGHLTNFEFELLEKCCEYIKVEIVFQTSNFNQKMRLRFKELGVECEEDYSYTIDLNEKKILAKEKHLKDTNISCLSFSEPLLQLAFVKHKIYEFISKGYTPQKIAVILPDEKLAPLLKSFDERGNFNFAMGESFTTSMLYKKLDSTCRTLDEVTQENMARLDRVGDGLFEELRKVYYETLKEFDIIEFLYRYIKDFTIKTELQIFKEEIYKFEKILSFVEDMNIKSLLNLFMQRLSKRTIDDVSGGQITVMGVLESRVVEFDAVVIVDFSDGHVPKKSDKDMFLNTNIRENAKLPTMNDRENLQKHYYAMLLRRTKEVAISFVKSEQSGASRFLKQLKIPYNSSQDELEYAKILFHKNSQKTMLNDEPIVLDYSFKDVKLSASRLKIFLSCKRKYYYRYIKQIQSHTIPKDMPQEWEIGVNIHLALKELYSKKPFYDDVLELKKDLFKELDKACGKSELDRYLMSLQKKRMEKFCQNEIQRFNSGFRVEFCEKTFQREFCGITIIGQIDRVDKRLNEVEILDYKTGKITTSSAKNYTEAIDFQLEFYYLLASEVGNVQSSSFYDLKDSTIVTEPFLKEKIDVLGAIIKDLLNIENIDFEMCEDTKHCAFCEYATICKRD